jgi:hypothetical protein
MGFDQREWVNEIVTGTLTGLVVGVVGVLFVPEAPLGPVLTTGGLGGLVTGVLNQPVRSLLNLRPKANQLGAKED